MFTPNLALAKLATQNVSTTLDKANPVEIANLAKSNLAQSIIAYG